MKLRMWILFLTCFLLVLESGLGFFLNFDFALNTLRATYNLNIALLSYGNNLPGMIRGLYKRPWQSLVNFLKCLVFIRLTNYLFFKCLHLPVCL